MRKAKFIMIFSLLSICFCACSSHIDDNSDDAFITLTVEDSPARTVLPVEISSVENYTDFVLTGTKNGTTETLASFSTYSALTGSSIAISAGTWNFALTAKRGNVSLLGNINNKLITAGSNSLSFSMDITGYGTNGDVGSVLFSLQLPTDNAVRSIQADLFSTTNAEALSNFTVKKNSSIGSTFAYDKSNVPVGVYRLKISLFADTDYKALINTYSELILIAHNCRSESTYTMAALNPVYSITYNLNGGYIDSNYTLPQSFSRLSHFSLPSVKYVKNTNGYGFVGWYTDANFTSERKFSVESGTTENITLYAKWSDSAIAVDSSELSTLDLSNIQNEKVLIVTGDISTTEQVFLSNALENASAAIVLDLSAANITEIEDYAFKDCTELTSILIPETVISIGEGAFKGCTNLSSINLPERLTSLGAYSFKDCSSLGEITIPAGITEIPNYAFANNTSLQTVSLHNNITSIGNYAFYACEAIIDFSFPNSLNSIGNFAFSRCTGLTVVALPNTVTTLGSNAFEQCSSLRNLTLSLRLAEIKDSTFRDCSLLQNIQIPNSVTSIGKSVFSNCSSITKITVPPTITKIDNFTFNGCTSLKEVVLQNGTGTLTLGYNTYDSTINGNRQKGFFADCPLEKLHLGRNIAYTYASYASDYGYSAFAGKTTLTEVSIGNTVTTIPSYTFRKCSSINSIELPESVTNIGYEAFRECTSLQNINLPSNLSSIGDYAFYDCNSIESTVVIPSSITSVHSTTFRYCGNMSFKFASSGTWGYSVQVVNRYGSSTTYSYKSDSKTVNTSDSYTFFRTLVTGSNNSNPANFYWEKRSQITLNF